MQCPLGEKSGLEPVDFATPVQEPDFYRGVKVKPGHVAAKLVLDRPKDVREVLDALHQRRQVLLSGPSGAGKSALVWLATAAAADHMRWYKVTGVATAADADAIVRFVRARIPSELSPLGLVFDEVGSSNSDLWDVLVREMRGVPALHLLGSVRQEDANLIANQSGTAFVRIALDEALAQSVWRRLSHQHLTSWTHWREPFEQSEGGVPLRDPLMFSVKFVIQYIDIYMLMIHVDRNFLQEHRKSTHRSKVSGASNCPTASHICKSLL